MKLRIEDDTLRLRLSEGEVREFAATGRVAAVVHFGPGPGQRLMYALERAAISEAAAVRVRYDGGGLTVVVPHDVAVAWTTTEQNGFSENLPLAETQRLRILVEKDLDCSHSDAVRLPIL